jgi:hypothetical protein
MASSTLRPITQAVLGDGDGIPLRLNRANLNPEAPAVRREVEEAIQRMLEACAPGDRAPAIEGVVEPAAPAGAAP